MFKLFHLPLCSSCRTARLLLAEKKIDFELKSELTWKRRKDFLKINPEGTVPVTVSDQGEIIIGAYILAQYLEEKNRKPYFMGDNTSERLEVRRLYRWFDKKFNIEVTNNIVFEKIFKRLEGAGEPSSSYIRAGRINLDNHLNYFEWILTKRTWFACEQITLADLVGAAYLSALDYLGEICWENYPFLKEWYAKVKSRPSFKAFLKEVIAGTPPVLNYSNLDF